MKRIILAVAILASTTIAARAQWTGSRIGQYTYWNNNVTGQSVTCSRIGNYTYCN